MATQFIGCDLAKVFEKSTGRTVYHTLYWGDEVQTAGTSKGRTKIKFMKHVAGEPDVEVTGYLGKDVVFTDKRPLQVRFVDVGQGDGAIVETPRGRLIVIDGGEEEHLHRYMRFAFPRHPIRIDAIVVTHGDADHFSGLTKLLSSEFAPAVTVERVFHNGLAKRPSKNGTKSRRDEEMFGATQVRAGEHFCTDLVDDLRSVDSADLNAPFLRWKEALDATKTAAGKSVAMKRLAAGSKFDLFEDEGVHFEVLGPIEEVIAGKPALRMLHKAMGTAGYSASHTVNGHSVVLRLTFGNVRFLFAADLNEESEEILLAAQADLAAEVLKVPHHGSADFSREMLGAVSPVVSIVSSGDENPKKDYIHPRAVLVGALGHASRVDRPLILVTEMVAFFDNLSKSELDAAESAGIDQWFRLTRKAQFGIVHVRTDGHRLLVVTRGARTDSVEAYAYKVDASHTVKSVPVTKS